MVVANRRVVFLGQSGRSGAWLLLILACFFIVCRCFQRPRETSWTYDDTRGAFTITALRGLNQGEQIYDSYGRKCNSRLVKTQKVERARTAWILDIDDWCVMSLFQILRQLRFLAGGQRR